MVESDAPSSGPGGVGVASVGPHSPCPNSRHGPEAWAEELRRHGPWMLQGTTEKHRDAFMNVREDRVIRPDGKPGTYSTVRDDPSPSDLEGGEAPLPHGR